MLLTVALKQFALGEKGLVCELGLVLEPDPIPGLTVLHYKLQDDDLRHFLSFWVGELALGDGDGYAGGQSMDTLIGELTDVREELIPEVPEMLL